MPVFSDLQQNALLLGCLDIHERLAEMEAAIVQADERTPFSRIAPDLTPVERRVLRDYFKRIREAMHDALQSHAIPIEVRPVSLRWSLQTAIVFLQIAVDEMGPSKLRGYGQLSDEGRTEALRIQQQFYGLIEKAARYLEPKIGGELSERLARLEGAEADLSKPLQELDTILTRQGLVELRPQFDLLVQRLETAQLEIAVLGRVSSGKSSLLNHIAGRDVLPVGVTPITAVPTRLTWGEQPEARVEFAISSPRPITVEKVAEYASEEANPGNIRHVTKIEVRLPSPRLRSGVVFVDTPGVGSLARAGAAETWAYLPRCDLGVVLIDSSSAINDEDLELLRLLRETQTPAQVLLSKADFLSPPDRQQALRYSERQIAEQLGEHLPVFPVSTVGEHERLLRDWFDHEIAPRTDQHRALVAQSLARKLGRLAESARAVLTLRKDRAPLASLQARPAQVRADLAAADDILREGASDIVRWSDDLQAREDEMLHAAAQRIVNDGRPASSPEDDLRAVVVERMLGRGQAARHRLEQLQKQLSVAIQRLADQAGPFRLDPAVVRDVPLTCLPIPDWQPPAKRRQISRPWWSGAAPALAATALAGDLSKRLKTVLDETARHYDRQLQTWMKDRLDCLQAAYDSQVEPLRQQLRRGSLEFGGEGAPQELEQDLHKLDRLLAGESGK